MYEATTKPKLLEDIYYKIVIVKNSQTVAAGETGCESMFNNNRID